MTHRIKKAATTAAENLIFKHPAARAARNVVKRVAGRHAQKARRKGRGK